MQYIFSNEDKQFYDFLEVLGISNFLDAFLEKQKDTICKSYNSLISEMENEQKSERHTEFLKDMNCEEFVSMIDFTFKVIFAKDLVNNSKSHDSVILSLAARNLAQKMSESPEDTIYISQLTRIISNCYNSILVNYKRL